GSFVGVSLAYGLLALALLSPWYVRNLVDTGNPLYPFGQSVFAGRNWSREADAYLNVYYDEYRTREAAQRGAKPYKGVEVALFPSSRSRTASARDRTSARSAWRSCLRSCSSVVGARPHSRWRRWDSPMPSSSRPAPGRTRATCCPGSPSPSRPRRSPRRRSAA